MLLEACRVIVAQTDIERELTGELPVVLDIESPLLLPKPCVGGRVNVCGIDQAQEEARVRESNRVAADGGGTVALNDVRKRRFRLTEYIGAVEVASI